jgi:hypothetical protein
MPRAGEFFPSNIARWVLTAIIVVIALFAVGFWLHQYPGHVTSITPPRAKGDYLRRLAVSLSSAA